MAGMRYQPQGKVKINPTHPFAKNVTGAWLFNTPDFRNIAKPGPAGVVTRGTVALTPYPKGICASPNSAYVETGLTASQLGINGNRKRTILIEYQNSDNNYNGMIMQLGGTTQTGAEFGISKIGYYNVGLQGYYADWSVPISPGYEAKNVQLAMMYDGTNMSYYAISLGNNGIVYRYSGSTAIGVHTDDTHTLGFFCGNFDHGGDYLREKVYSVVILSDRVATPSEIEAYFACPYQLYESLE